VIASVGPTQLDFSKGSPLKGGSTGKKNYQDLLQRLKINRKLVLTEIETRNLTTLEDNLFTPFAGDLKASPIELDYSLRKGKGKITSIKDKLDTLKKNGVISNYRQIILP
jgi:hypothetical protein